MTNITKNWNRVYESNNLDSKSIERVKRSIVIVQDTNGLHIKNLGEANFSANLAAYNLSGKSGELVNQTDNNIDNYIEFMSPKELIDLAFSAFGMQYHISAGRFLKEAAFSLGMQHV